MTDYARARYNMVEGQLRPNRVTDPLLTDAMGSIPRELFVPLARRPVSYVDEDLAIGGDRFLMEPRVFGRLVEAAGIAAGDVVLDVGCATGYSTAVLCQLADTVVATDPDAALVAQASATLNQLEIGNGVVFRAEVGDGFPDQAPYDVIVVNGAVAKVPPALLSQLADQGRLVVVVREDERIGHAALYQHLSGTVSHRILFDAGIPYLPGMAPVSQFVL